GDASTRRPPRGFDYFQRAPVLAQSIGKRAVELQPVAVRSHAGMAQEVPRILMAEKILASGHRSRIELRESSLQRVIERIACFLEPVERVLPQHPGVVDRRREIEAAI